MKTAIVLKNLKSQLVILCLVALVVSCGGSGGSNESRGGESGRIVTLSGIATDEPVSGGTVTVKDSNENQLCSTTTDGQGNYSCSVKQSALTNGVVIEVTGGNINGIALNGRLEAIYGSGDPVNAANVTLVTTLVSKIAATELAPTLIARRDAVLQRLTKISLFGSEKWNAPEPSSVGLSALRNDITTSSLDTVIFALAVDLQDNDLSADNMQYFPRAHGGIIQLLVEGGDNQSRIDALPGDNVGARITAVLANDTNAIAGYEKNAGPEALSIDPLSGVITFTLPQEMVNGEVINFTVRARTADSYRDINGKIIAHAAKTLLEEVASGERQVITDDFGRFVVEVPTNNTLPAGTKIRLRSFTDSEGNAIFRLDTDQPLAEGRSLLLHFPDPDIFGDGEQMAKNGLGAQSSLMPQSYKESAENVGPVFKNRVQTINIARPPPIVQKTPCQKGNDKKYAAAGYEWSRYINYFTLAGNFAYTRTRNYDRYTITIDAGDYITLRGRDVKPEVTSILCSTVQDGTTDITDHEPILFIHGYLLGGGIGGGNGTWGNFLGIVDSWTVKGRDVVPFEFRWRTNARYQDVAEDLWLAVRTIEKATKRKVHIVAHSFGGLLARTYLQGLAEIASGSSSAEYTRPIASLTTIGTPNSGIGSGMTDGLISLCNQASCFQAGLESDEGTFEEYQKLYKSFVRNEIIDALKPKTEPGGGKNNSFPAKLPVNVLIGLRANIEFRRPDELGDGDGLIGYWGQRWSPDDKKTMRL